MSTQSDLNSSEHSDEQIDEAIMNACSQISRPSVDQILSKITECDPALRTISPNEAESLLQNNVLFREIMTAYLDKRYTRARQSGVSPLPPYLPRDLR